ncbi:uncharacterized protein LOC144160011 [Haemaphysalis longicornis]
MPSEDKSAPPGLYLDSQLRPLRVPAGQPPPQHHGAGFVDELFATARTSGGAAKSSRGGERSVADLLAPTDQLTDNLAPVSSNCGMRSRPLAALWKEPWKEPRWREGAAGGRGPPRRVQELGPNAKRELELAEWYERYHDSLAKHRTANRSSADWLPEGGRADADGTPDLDNKVARLGGFNAKPSSSGKDVSRMRSIGSIYLF